MSEKDSTQSVEAVISLGDHKKKYWQRWPFWAVVVVLAAIAFVVSRQGGAELPNYVQDQIRRGSLRVTVTATGTLQPTNQIDVGSEVSGLIDEVLVDFNDRVEVGQVLVRLDTEQLEARVTSARAALASARATQAQAEATLEETRARAKRSKELNIRNLASQQNLEADVASERRAEASVLSAEAQVVSAEAALKETETALRKAVVRAPIDGMVISREIEPGQTVAATFQTPVLFKLVEDLRHMELLLDVDEADIGHIREGQSALFRVDAYPTQEFSAEIISVRFNPQTVNNIVTYETVLSVDNPDLLLRPGMTATADILVVEKQDILLAPNRALRFLPPDQVNETDADGDSVWVIRNSEAVEIPVRIGLANDQFTELLDSTLAPGDEVIVDLERDEEQQQGGLFQ